MEIRQRLTNALIYTGMVERTVLHEESKTLNADLLQVEPETLNADLLQEEEAEAKAVVEKERPELTMFMNGFQLGNGAAEYAVIWKHG